MPLNDASPEIEFWFDFASSYSYLSVMRIEDAAATIGAKVVWRPFMLGPIFNSFGWDNSPFVLQNEKGEYMWKDMVRECRKYGLPWNRPSTFPRLSTLPARVAIVAADKPWVGEYCRRIMLLNFASDRDIHSQEAVGDVLINLGLPALQILSEAQSATNKPRLRQQTETAKVKRIFGAPTFLVNNELFWGNDRLDDALHFARQRVQERD